MFGLFKKDKDTVVSTAQQEINILDIKNNPTMVLHKQ